ncbi:MAG: hypothetical protein LBI69_01830 [Puniceicoccales bacterium]|nr:hypothetical protein [Puniceicoccales bacterium]
MALQDFANACAELEKILNQKNQLDIFGSSASAPNETLQTLKEFNTSFMKLAKACPFMRMRKAETAPVNNGKKNKNIGRSMIKYIKMMEIKLKRTFQITCAILDIWQTASTIKPSEPIPSTLHLTVQ